MKRLRLFTPSEAAPNSAAAPGIRRFRADVGRYLQAIGIAPTAADDGRIIAAWLAEQTAEQFAFNFAEEFGAISLQIRGRR
jgi:hypothetical protein